MLEQRDIGGELAPEAVVPSFTLAEYLAKARGAIRTSMPPEAWVEAVVLEAKPTNAGLPLELIEPGADHRRDGRLTCMIRNDARKAIEADLGLTLDGATLTGSQTRLRVTPTFHPKWHLEGRVVGIDPAIVASIVARRLEMIRKTLREENLYGAQQRLPVPVDVTSVAVIHPDRSAGWADVRTELERLQDRGILHVASFPVPFARRKAAWGIAAELAGIGGGDAPPDVIMVIRGGGAAAGFVSLADLALARAVCRCRVPIVTGIGHASDRTILDDVAWRAADTPSKALGTVKAILRKRCLATSGDHRTIVDAMDRLLTTTLSPLLASSRISLIEAADKITATQNAKLRDARHGIERHVIAFRGEIAATQADLDRTAAELLAVAPLVPTTARKDCARLFSGVLRASRARLPISDSLTAEARRSSGIVAAFVDRQAIELGKLLAALNAAARRRLDDEALRLAAASSAARALDVMATLGRGFALPLDERRRIIRSAEAARAAEGFELLFTDGSVACRPVTF